MSKVWTAQNNSYNNNMNDSNVNNNNSNGSNTSLSTPPGNIVRNLLVHISGNRATWEHMGIHGALWQVTFFMVMVIVVVFVIFMLIT